MRRARSIEGDRVPVSMRAMVTRPTPTLTASSCWVRFLRLRACATWCPRSLARPGFFADTEDEPPASGRRPLPGARRFLLSFAIVANKATVRGRRDVSGPLARGRTPHRPPSARPRRPPDCRMVRDRLQSRARPGRGGGSPAQCAVKLRRVHVCQVSRSHASPRVLRRCRRRARERSWPRPPVPPQSGAPTWRSGTRLPTAITRPSSTAS